MLKSIYLNNRLFIAVGLCVFLFLMGFAYPVVLALAKIAVLVLVALLAIDLLMLYQTKQGIRGSRDCAERLSNGDENPIYIHLENRYPFVVRAKVIDETPFQFQLRNLEFYDTIQPRANRVITYHLRPVKRGEYRFGTLNVFVSALIGFASRRYRFVHDKMVPVYPSYLQMRQYELLAISDRLTELGIKKIRRIGQNREFEQIKEYVGGDDIRTINWKATARRNTLMVNHYQDEKSQQVYSVIDKGRNMKMPFNGMSLLDYAINASLVISNIALLKEDKAGIITFSHRIGTILPAGKVQAQMRNIMEVLYNQKTNFKESDFDTLYINIRRKVNQRSLLLLYTNFETLSSMERQLPYLKRLAQSHVLVVIFFENTELRTLLDEPAFDTEEIYIKTIAEKFAFEKKQIVKELKRYGIYSILTAPQHLTANTVNKYLELKARGVI
jgi:uncharacterized protein (DUF58 family)